MIKVNGIGFPSYQAHYAAQYAINHFEREGHVTLWCDFLGSRRAYVEMGQEFPWKAADIINRVEHMVLLLESEF